MIQDKEYWSPLPQACPYNIDDSPNKKINIINETTVYILIKIAVTHNNTTGDESICHQKDQKSPWDGEFIPDRDWRWWVQVMDRFTWEYKPWKWFRQLKRYFGFYIESGGGIVDRSIPHKWHLHSIRKQKTSD